MAANRAENAARRRLRLLSEVDRFFMASAVVLFQSERDWDDADLAGWLACDIDGVRRLSLCRRPLPDSDGFSNDIETIAAYVRCEADRLVQLVREVDAIEAIRQRGRRDADPLLMAARDRKEPSGGVS